MLGHQALRNELKVKTVPNQKWQEERSKFKFARKEMNKLVFNHLILEANKEAVEALEKETGESVEYNRELLAQRDRVRKHIIKWDIDEAVKIINEINSEILEINTKLMFELQKQKLIKLLSDQQTEEALTLVQAKLYSIAVTDKELFADFEKLMILFAYNSISDSPFRYLISEDYVKKLVMIVNQEILKFQNERNVSSLGLMIKTMKWNQDQLKAQGIKFPEINQISPLAFKNEN